MGGVDPPLLRGGCASRTGPREPDRMPSLPLALSPAPAPAPLGEATEALQARVVGELDRPQAVPDLFRLFERRDEQGDLGPILGTLERASKSPRARPDVRALSLEMQGE